MVGKSSKKGWRSVKLDAELAVRAEHEQMAELASKGDDLFTEDTKGKLQGVSRKIVREVKLLNKSSSRAAADSEAKLVEKYASQVNVAKSSPQQKKRLSDIWADAPVKKLKPLVTSSVIRRESFAPGVVPAGAELSVNPAPMALEAAILSVAEKEMNHSPFRVLKRVISESVASSPAPEATADVESVVEKALSVRKTKAEKLKQAKHKQMLKEHEIRRKERAARRMAQDKPARLAREADQAERREAKLRMRAKRIVAEASGKLALARGAGGRLTTDNEVLPPTEVATCLRRLVPKGDPILERRASLLKRRMIEQVPELNNGYKEKLRYNHYEAKKAIKMLDKDAKARCLLLE